MSKRIFTLEEQELLWRNPNVASCSDKSISFTSLFKQRAVREHKEGKTPQKIFATAGLPLSLIGRRKPRDTIQRWLTVERNQGIDSLLHDGRGSHTKGGRKRTERVDLDAMTIEEQNAYLKAENDFLAQLRGIPRTSFKYRPGDDMK
jgi:hypothetical protein